MLRIFTQYGWTNLLDGRADHMTTQWISAGSSGPTKSFVLMLHVSYLNYDMVTGVPTSTTSLFLRKCDLIYSIFVPL